MTSHVHGLVHCMEMSRKPVSSKRGARYWSMRLAYVRDVAASTHGGHGGFKKMVILDFALSRPCP